MERREIVSKRCNVTNVHKYNMEVAHFSDKDILIDVLNTTKSLSLLYGTLVTEASNNELLKKVKALSTEIGAWQRQIFNFIYERGWYPLEAESKQKVGKAVKKFTISQKDMK